MIVPAERLSALPTYVFARLEELKALAREQGLDLIDLGMGNPDGPPPQPIIDAAITALSNPQNHGYPPLKGQLVSAKPSLLGTKVLTTLI